MPPSVPEEYPPFSLLDFFSLVNLISLSIFQDIDFIFIEEWDFFLAGGSMTKLLCLQVTALSSHSQCV